MAWTATVNNVTRESQWKVDLTYADPTIPASVPESLFAPFGSTRSQIIDQIKTRGRQIRDAYAIDTSTLIGQQVVI